MGNVTWTPDALEDLAAATAYIAEGSPEFAPEFAVRIANAVRHLDEFPQLGRQVPELEIPSVREVVFSRYRIIYQLRDDATWIIAVMHGTQDFSAFAERRKWNLS